MQKPKMKIEASMCRRIFKLADESFKKDGYLGVSVIFKEFGFDPWILLRYRPDVPDRPVVWYTMNEFGKDFSKCFEVDRYEKQDTSPLYEMPGIDEFSRTYRNLDFCSISHCVSECCCTALYGGGMCK